MRRIEPFQHWQGNIGDARDFRVLAEHDIEALVELAGEEPAAVTPRGLTFLRFPLSDGRGNPEWLLRMAVRAVGDLIQAGVPTLDCCSAGQSRSPAVVAAALSINGHGELDHCLALTGARDVTPGFWSEVTTLFGRDLRDPSS